MKLFGTLILLTMVIIALAISDEEDSHDSLEERGTKVTVATGSTLNECLTCICHVESNCSDIGCIDLGIQDDGGYFACGPYLIKSDYWIDGGSQGSDYESCARDLSCAEKTTRSYVNRYATYRHLGETPTCEHWARIHDGGPNGYSLSSTDDFWNRVQQQGCSA